MAIDWIWLAGFTDGDGCIPIRHGDGPTGKESVVRIRWGQKQEQAHVLDLIAVFLSSQGLADKTPRRFNVSTQGHRYPQAELGYGSQHDVRIILTNLLPHLVIKQQAAVDGIAVLDELARLRQECGHYFRKPNNGGWGLSGPRTLGL